MQSVEETDYFSNCKRIFHGSANIIKEPKLNLGKPNNDYGRGFYCTEDIERAREWAAGHSDSLCYVNKYNLDIKGLQILNFRDSQYNILHWITVLIEHRQLAMYKLPIAAKQAYNYLVQKYHICISDYDIVIGYRADDSYFAFARDFLLNILPLEDLKRAIVLGHLGEQLVLISKKAFSQLNFLGVEIVNRDKYYKLFMSRDLQARNSYFDMSVETKNPHFIQQIMREDWSVGDERLS